MTTQVRTFNIPQPLGDRLAETPEPPKTTPRTVPWSLPISSNQIKPPKPESTYRRVPMAQYNGYKKPAGITFASQDSLPKLPIPDLKSTAQKYLEALKPLQSPREHSETRQAVEDFLRGDGPNLQEKLENYAESKTSYIEQFCKMSTGEHIPLHLH